MNSELDRILLNISKSEVIDKGDLESSIQMVLNSVIEGLNVKRAGIWFLEDEGKAIQCKLLKDVQNNTESDDLRLTDEDFPRYFDYLRTERSIIANRAREDESTSEFTASYLIPLNIYSMMDVPIRHQGRMVGIICCEHTGAPRQWNHDESVFVSALADLIGRAINAKNYKEAADRLRRLNSELEERVERRTLALQKAVDSLRATQDQLIESEKMAALGGMVSGVAHEVNTPLGVSITALSHLDNEFGKIVDAFNRGELNESIFTQFVNEGREATSILNTNLSRAAKLIKAFKKTAVNQSEKSITTFYVSDIAQSSLSSLHPLTKPKSISINYRCTAGLSATNHAGALSQVIVNLVTNSVSHAFENTKNPTIDIRFERDDDDIHLLFKDNGAGIPQSDLKKIFEPFFTTKRNRGGTGLGLAILYNLVKQELKGSVKASSAIGEGTTFDIRFPANLMAPVSV